MALGSSEHGAHVGTAIRTWRRAPLGAIAWLAPDGEPGASSVFPLTEGDRPRLALPYARLDLARSLAASDEVTLAVPSPSDDDRPVVVRGRATVQEDPDGARFHSSGLIEMELGKYPTSRRRLDSLLLRREHWWFLPRLIVDIGELSDARTIVPGDALLITGGRSLEVAPCRLADRDPLVLAAEQRPTGRRPAVVIEHGGDLPELERPWERRWHGALVGDRFETDAIHGEGPESRALTLRQRMRAERQLERACKDGLRTAGHG